MRLAQQNLEPKQPAQTPVQKYPKNFSSLPQKSGAVFKESYKSQNKREKEEREEPTSSLAKRETAKVAKDTRMKRLERKKTKVSSGVATSKDTIEKMPAKVQGDSKSSKMNENDTTSIDSRAHSKQQLSKSKNDTLSQAEEEEEEEEEE